MLIPGKLNSKFKDKTGKMNKTAFLLRSVVTTMEDQDFLHHVLDWKYKESYQEKYDLDERNFRFIKGLQQEQFHLRWLTTPKDN